MDLLTWTRLVKHCTGALETGRHTGCKGHGWTTAISLANCAPHFQAWCGRPTSQGARGRKAGARAAQHGAGDGGPGRDTVGTREVSGSSTSGPTGLSLDTAMGAQPAVGNPSSALAPAPCPAGAPTDARAPTDPRALGWWPASARVPPAKDVRMREGSRADWKPGATRKRTKWG